MKNLFVSIENYVYFVGQVDYTNVDELYRNVELYVFTIQRDTSGKVVLEAMAQGIPVVDLNGHGAADIVTEQIGNLIEITSYNKI